MVIGRLYEAAGRTPPSAGQLINQIDHVDRQLVALARALAAKPSLLLLDEATSALETVSERNVLRLIRATNVTLIVVSHRPDSSDMADLVVNLSPAKPYPAGSVPGD